MLRHRASLQWGVLAAPRASHAHPAATQATDPGTAPSKLTQPSPTSSSSRSRALRPEINANPKPKFPITTAQYNPKQERLLAPFRPELDNRAKKAIEKEKVYRLIAETQAKIIAKLDESAEELAEPLCLEFYHSQLYQKVAKREEIVDYGGIAHVFETKTISDAGKETKCTISEIIIDQLDI